MNLILTTIMQERQRIEYMLDRYQSDLSSLPKGVLTEKKTDGKTYYYLKYRNGKKVISQYVKREDADVLREQIERRKHIEAMIRSLREEQSIAMKALEGHL